jgi:hypothetical protein
VEIANAHHLNTQGHRVAGSHASRLSTRLYLDLAHQARKRRGAISLGQRPGNNGQLQAANHHALRATEQRIVEERERIEGAAPLPALRNSARDGHGVDLEGPVASGKQGHPAQWGDVELSVADLLYLWIKSLGDE